MPAAPFIQASDIYSLAVRQWAIGPAQCRWIVADEGAGADALMCGAPSERHRPFCAIHCALAYMKLVPEEEAESEAAKTTDEDPETEEAK